MTLYKFRKADQLTQALAEFNIIAGRAEAQPLSDP